LRRSYVGFGRNEVDLSLHQRRHSVVVVPRFMGQAKKDQPQEEEEESILTSEIEYASFTDEGIHTAMLEAHAGLYRRDDETRWYRRDVVIPICKEIIARFKRPGVAAQYRLNDQPT
jgi:hypothetical protein